MIKSKFYCEPCEFKFEDEGFKKEWQDKMYGPCWKRLAYCPKCHKPVDELYSKSSSSKSADFDSYVDSLKKNGGGGCNPGGGCCG